MQEHHHRTRNRLSKEEVKEDEFIAWLYRLVGYAETNYPKLIAGVAAVAVIVVAIVFINSSTKQKEAAAVDAIGAVQVHIMQGDVAGAITEAQRVVREFGGHAAAGYAQMMLGSVYFDQGRYDDARRTFQAFLDEFGSNGPQGYAAWAGIAACAVEQDNLTNAAQKYLQYADAHADGPFAALSLQEAARCYELAGNIDRQAEVLQRIVGEYPDTPTRREAEADLRVLGRPVG